MAITLHVLPEQLTVCKVESTAQIDLSAPLTFVGHTDEELSLVCPTERTPAHTLAREDGWRAFRIVGTLDFSLVGILAPIATLLAQAKIGIFAVSTYNTDYVLVKGTQLAQALEVLAGAGYPVD